MEIIEIVSYYVYEDKRRVDVTFRLTIDSDDEVRNDIVCLDESEEYGYNLIEDDFLFNMITNFHQASNFNSYSQISEISKYLIQNYLAEKEADKLNYPNWGHIILEIKNLLDCHMDDKINIERMAKKYNKTSFQLIRAFKAHTGLTPIAYLILIRLNKAKKLLASGNTLIDTALKCGFFDQSHFANCFNKYFGVSPKQYSENYSNLKTE
jgi:AraC-like DNA-binding protein